MKADPIGGSFSPNKSEVLLRKTIYLSRMLWLFYMYDIASQNQTFVHPYLFFASLSFLHKCGYSNRR